MVLDEFCQMARKRLKQDKDAVFCISGEEGIGKSTLAIEVAKGIDKDFKLETHELIKPTAEEMTKKITELPKGSAIICDESMRILYKQQWQNRKQKYLNKLFSLCRQEQKIVILCLPRFTDLNEYFRNWRVLVWIHVLDRGKAILFARDWSPFCKDIWWLDENQKLIERYRGHKRLIIFDTDDKVKVLAKSKNFMGVLDFPDLDEETKKQYLDMKSKVSYEEDEEDSISLREKQHLDELALLIKERIDAGETGQAIANKLGCSQQRVSRLLKHHLTPTP